jgi:hypothetical protein
MSRGDEIQYYLSTDQSITHYCIVDDDNDMLDSQKDNFVRTDFKTGLTEDNIEQIKKILS